MRALPEFKSSTNDEIADDTESAAYNTLARLSGTFSQQADDRRVIKINKQQLLFCLNIFYALF